MNPIVAEVCVLGDGPAGASMAFRLARLGHDVVLIGDGLPHHRRLLHSISPGIRPFLDLLDLHEPLDAFATECDPPDVRWETAEPLGRPASGLSGHLVDRSHMDVCLRDIARRAGVQIGLMLEEVEVTPGHPLGVVGRTVRRATGRAGEAAAWREVDLDIQAMGLRVEVRAHHCPWRRQAERLLHQRRIIQARALRILSGGSILLQPGAALAAVKDATRRASAVASGHP